MIFIVQTRAIHGRLIFNIIALLTIISGNLTGRDSKFTIVANGCTATAAILIHVYFYSVFVNFTAVHGNSTIAVNTAAIGDFSVNPVSGDFTLFYRDGTVLVINAAALLGAILRNLCSGKGHRTVSNIETAAGGCGVARNRSTEQICVTIVSNGNRAAIIALILAQRTAIEIQSTAIHINSSNALLSRQIKLLDLGIFGFAILFSKVQRAHHIKGALSSAHRATNDNISAHSQLCAGRNIKVARRGVLPSDHNRSAIFVHGSCNRSGPAVCRNTHLRAEIKVLQQGDHIVIRGQVCQRSGKGIIPQSIPFHLHGADHVLRINCLGEVQITISCF